jgi:hypothetical protein
LARLVILAYDGDDRAARIHDLALARYRRRAGFGG